MPRASKRRVGTLQRGRTGISTTVAAIILVIVVVAALGGYLALSSTATRTSTSTTSSSAKQSTSVESSSSTASRSSSSSGVSYPFSLSLNDFSRALVSPGSFTDIVYVKINHPVEPNGEAVYLNSTSPAGIQVAFTPSSLVLAPANGTAGVTLEITASANATLGNDTIGIQAASGQYSQSTSFTLGVVQYLVFMSHATVEQPSMFLPTVLNVTVGSTVYWQNLDGNYANCGENASTSTGIHSVVFTTIPGANSSTVEQFQVYSYTFTTPGSYFYYSSIDPDHSMSGTINVLAADGAGVGDVAAIPAFSYFKGGTTAITPIAAPTTAATEPGGKVGVMAAASDSAKGLSSLNARLQPFSALPLAGKGEAAFGLAALGGVALAIAVATMGRRMTALGIALGFAPSGRARRGRGHSHSDAPR